jgi:hypothetical protein
MNNGMIHKTLSKDEYDRTFYKRKDGSGNDNDNDNDNIINQHPDLGRLDVSDDDDASANTANTANNHNNNNNNNNHNNHNNHKLFIPQGGYSSLSSPGCSFLSNAITSWWRGHGDVKTKKLVVFVPSGTGTTAYYTSEHIKRQGQRQRQRQRQRQKRDADADDNVSDNVTDNITVVAIPCIGNRNYLIQQMSVLSRSNVSNEKKNEKKVLNGGYDDGYDDGNGHDDETETQTETDTETETDDNTLMSIPDVMDVKANFGRLKPHHWSFYKTMKQVHGIELDLLYNVPSLCAVVDLLSKNRGHDRGHDEGHNEGHNEGHGHYCEKDYVLLYVNSGGLEGNRSMIQRYRKKGYE